WCFTTDATAQLDRTEILGSRGMIRFACFEPTPVEWHTSAGVESFDLIPPQPVAQPLIERVVATLQGRGTCPSTGETALRTSEVMEAICRRSAATIQSNHETHEVHERRSEEPVG
ncbi:MAG: hypothetical protein KDM81_15730, partial [Verrucomicrobiae bacterium]|nr:hypothetical protein [Verrucomicrobiae bacterium]